MTDLHTTEQPTSATDTTTEGNALAVAEHSVRLLISGPAPLAVDGRTVDHRLPARPVDLGELRDLLLNRTAPDDLKDIVWRELVHRARSGDPAWVIGCAGVAMPGLKNTAARVLRTSPQRYADDIVSELLTEFVAQLARIDVERPHIAARLMLWARKGALRARGRETRLTPCDPHTMPDHPADPSTDPVNLLLDAVRQKIISPSAAELIITTRLEAVSVQNVARGHGVAATRLYKQRQTAEKRVAAAIHNGLLTQTLP